MRRYNGYVLLEVNGLESQSEAEAVRREAAALPQTLLAFVGLSGRSVKIVVPFVLPDGSLPKKEEQARMFHATAYQLAVRHYQPQLGSIISLKEPFLSRGCRMSGIRTPITIRMRWRSGSSNLCRCRTGVT